MRVSGVLRWSPRRPAGGTDQGFALVTVLGTMLLLMLFVLAATTFATNNVANSRRSQDYAAAMAAAQAGVDDFLSRLNVCDTYWSSPCPGSPAEPARDQWATVPGSDGALPAQYTYSIVSTPATTPGLIRVRAQGRVNGVTRSITADMRKKGFLEFIYYTDKEALAPSLYQEVYGSSGAGCAYYYYAVPPSSDRRTNTSCDINFVGGDVIRGPLYTKDAMLLLSQGGLDPKFAGPAETFWQASYSPAATPSAPYRKNGSSSKPDPTGYTPQIATRSVDLPPTNTAIRDAAADDGCVYSGPTKIVLNSSGTMTVTSPGTTSAAPGCGPGTGLSLPDNGVIYVDARTSCTSAKPVGYPVTGDITTYDCKAGDAFVEGTLKGQLTIATAGDIVITDDLVYHQAVWNGTAIDTTVTDVLGLVAQGWTKVYHPVSCTSTSSSCEITSATSNIEINAAILAVNNSFTVQNYRRGSSRGTLHIRGGIYQRYRGPVGTTAPTGFLKDYVHDTRLVSLPPPYFLDPPSAPWEVVGLSE
jgi:Tfp pilus assembly protein PilX